MTRIATYVTSAADAKGFPPPTLPEIAVAGRSNVGKSTLINAMVRQRGLAKTSRSPGRTRLVNWFWVPDGNTPGVHLVDLPGYGYAEVARAVRASWQPLIEAYLTDRTSLAAVLLLVDIRRGPEAEEHDFVAWLAERNIPTYVALTKGDKLPKNQRLPVATATKRAMDLNRLPYIVSADSGDGVDEIWRAMTAAARAKTKG